MTPEQTILGLIREDDDDDDDDDNDGNNKTVLTKDGLLGRNFLVVDLPLY